MSSCEKCWRDAGGNPDNYNHLVSMRNATGRKCTPEEQAGGVDAEVCPKCKRHTVHLHTHKCVNPECKQEDK